MLGLLSAHDDELIFSDDHIVSSLVEEMSHFFISEIWAKLEIYDIDSSFTLLHFFGRGIFEPEDIELAVSIIVHDDVVDLEFLIGKSQVHLSSYGFDWGVLFLLLLNFKSQ